MTKLELAAATLVSFMAASYVQAQAQTGAVSPGVLDSLVAQFAPMLVTVVGTLLAGIVAAVLLKLRTVLGVQQENAKVAGEVQDRNVLHDAAWSAAKYAAQVTGAELKEGAIPPKDFIEAGIKYVRDKNPDVTKGQGDNVLKDILISKVPDLLKLATPSAVTEVVVKPVAATAKKG